MSAAVASTAAGRAEAEPLLSRLATQGRTLARRFHQRNPRERLLLIACGVALVGVLADQLWLGAALKDWKAARSTLAGVRQQQETLQADIAQRQARGATLARQHQADLAQWRQRLKDGDEALRRHADALVGPDRMLDLLDKLLARHGEVRVRALRSLGRSDVLNPAAGAALAAATAPARAGSPVPATPSPTGGLYRHGVELVLEGSYADLLAYLQAMEGLPQRMLWGTASLQVEQHPRCVLTLRVHTLSRDPHWLEL